MDNGVISGSGTIGGTLYNYNRAIAGNLSGYGNLTMGGLESSGELVSRNGNKFIVNGAANVEGSTVKVENVMLEENITVLEVQSITGNLKNTSFELSGLTSSTVGISGNTILARVYVSNNLGEVDETQAQAYNAVKNISDNLKNDSRQNELYYLLNFEAANAKNALSEIGSSNSADMMSLTQKNSVVDRVISERLATAFSTKNLRELLQKRG